MRIQMVVMLLSLCMCLCLAGCSAISRGEDSASETVASYTCIDQETAKEMMERDDGRVVVDVRRMEEYEEGHIPGALLLPVETIGDERPEELPDLDQIILIYCRSGNRSKTAAQKLADMGYTSVYEFGGINTWTGEIVAGEEIPDNVTGTDGDEPAKEGETAEERRLQITAAGKVLTATLPDTPIPPVLQSSTSSCQDPPHDEPLQSGDVLPHGQWHPARGYCRGSVLRDRRYLLLAPGGEPCHPLRAERGDLRAGQDRPHRRGCVLLRGPSGSGCPL